MYLPELMVTWLITSLTGGQQCVTPALTISLPDSNHPFKAEEVKGQLQVTAGDRQLAS